MSVEYEVTNEQMYVIDEKGERERLANFVAEITDEVRYVDGKFSETLLTIKGNNSELEFPPITIEAESFPGMSWVLPEWGVQAIISPGTRVKDDIRAFIQQRSTPNKKTIYKKVGWQEINGKTSYLHANGAISQKGNDSSISVELPHELSGYSLELSEEPNKSIQATLSLAFLTKPEIMWPLIAATLTPIYGPVDFAMHVTGRTGTYKSELMALLQSHYGKAMDSRHLPGSWSSTANALEAQAYYAANAAFVVDDFVPTGTAWQVRSYQSNAEKLLRSQGNQSGRARLTDTSHLQTTMYPRGIILSTGEDVPEGHSVRARMMIIELAPGDISTKELTKAQKRREKFNNTTAELIKHLCQFPADISTFADEIRDKYLDLGHARTPTMVGRLIATICHFLEWAKFVGAIDESERAILESSASEAIVKAGEQQASYLESADPCDVFCASIRHVLASNMAHLRTINGGIPTKPTILGWTEQGGMEDFPTFKSHGPCIGWVSWKDDYLYLDANTGYNTVKKHAAELTITKQTMLKRLKDSGLLGRIDDARQRNTIRITAESNPKQVLALPLSQVLQTQEAEND